MTNTTSTPSVQANIYTIKEKNFFNIFGLEWEIPTIDCYSTAQNLTNNFKNFQSLFSWNTETGYKYRGLEIKNKTPLSRKEIEQNFSDVYQFLEKTNKKVTFHTDIDKGLGIHCHADITELDNNSLLPILIFLNSENNKNYLEIIAERQKCQFFSLKYERETVKYGLIYYPSYKHTIISYLVKGYAFSYRQQQKNLSQTIENRLFVSSYTNSLISLELNDAIGQYIWQHRKTFPLFCTKSIYDNPKLVETKDYENFCNETIETHNYKTLNKYILNNSSEYPNLVKRIEETKQTNIQ